MEETQQPVVFPEQDDLESLFSDQKDILPEPALSLLPSLTGTSVPLLSNPAMTDTFSNFRLFSSQAGLEPAVEDEPQEENYRRNQAQVDGLRHQKELSIEGVDQEEDHQVVEEEVLLHQVEQKRGQPDKLFNHREDQEVECEPELSPEY